ILARTDGFMYHCKEEGKNRCLVDDLSIPQAAQPTASAPVTDPAPHQTVTGKVVAPQIVHIPALFGRVDIHAPVSIAVVYRHSTNGAPQQAADSGMSGYSNRNAPVFDLIIYPAQYTPPHLLNPRQDKNGNSNHADKKGEDI
ncbi:MAG: hypothetical protein PHY03_07295, partial [Dehalococcoidia bacterium]|nr:hypothetical protein [Dehalococcoidia bacterium]